MSTFKIKKPRPIFRRNLRAAPAHPLDDRVLVRESKPESETEGGMAMAEEAKRRPMNGILVTVGDTAADYCYDRAIEVGDTVLYAQYAGVRHEWPHVVGPDSPECEHDGSWDRVGVPSPTLEALRGRTKEDDEKARKWALAGGPNDNIELHECRACKTLIAKEEVIVMSCKDILMSVEAQERLERGEVVRYRGVTADGQTRHYMKRLTDRPECFGGVEPTERDPLLTGLTRHTNGQTKEMT